MRWYALGIVTLLFPALLSAMIIDSSVLPPDWYTSECTIAFDQNPAPPGGTTLRWWYSLGSIGMRKSWTVSFYINSDLIQTARPVIGPPAHGSILVNPGVTTTYTGMLVDDINGTGPFYCHATLEVISSPPPPPPPVRPRLDIAGPSFAACVAPDDAPRQVLYCHPVQPAQFTKRRIASFIQVFLFHSFTKYTKNPLSNRRGSF